MLVFLLQTAPGLMLRQVAFENDGKEIIKGAFSSFALLLLFSSLFFPL